MKLLIKIIVILCVLLLILVLFLWMLYHASGHNVPAKTDRGFVTTIAISILVILVLTIFKRNKFDKRPG